MKIIAASIQQAAETFLHAGYISAYPRTLSSYHYGHQAPRMELEVAEALRLKGEVLASVASTPDSLGLAAATASPKWPTLLLGGALLGGTLLLLYTLLRRFPSMVPQLQARHAAAAMVALLALGVWRCGGPEPLPTEAPWKDVTLQQYHDPAAATRVLLHGIIADGIADVGQPIEMLENIQNEVGLPANQLTRGQAYALKTYGIDGWGKKFRLSEAGGKYTVTSAGADGAFDSADDISISVTQNDDQSWDNGRSAFFVRKDGGSLVVLFHRWSGEHFIYKNQSKAAALTGGGLFDLFLAADLESKGLTLALQGYDKAAAAATYEPLVLQVF